MRYLLVAILFVTLCSYGGCYKDYFQEDPANPGISVFSDRSLQVTSFYYNGAPWVRSFSESNGPDRGRIELVQTNSDRDSLFISWHGGLASNAFGDEVFTIGLPVKKGFQLQDFYAFNGQRFPNDSTTVSMSLNGNPDPTFNTSSGRIFFTGIEPITTDSSGLLMFGLFDGEIGTNTKIRKGRFDCTFQQGDNLYIP